MIVKCRVKYVKPMLLPGGGTKGTLLRLLLFIVLINDIGFADQKNDLGDIFTSRTKMKEMNEIHLNL